MKIIIILLPIGFLIMYVIGFLAQLIFEKLVETHPNRGKFKFSYCVPEMLRVYYNIIKINILKNFINKYKIYYEESKKENWDYVGDLFLSTVIDEEKSTKSGIVIQSILHQQENNRRKNEDGGESKKKFFFAREVIFTESNEESNSHQIPYALYLDYYVQYHMFLKGKKVSNFSLLQGVGYFGTEEEKTLMLKYNESYVDFERIYYNSLISKKRRTKGGK